MHCPYCGVINEGGSKFCEKCGFNLVEENITSPYEEYAPTYGRFTKKLERKLENSKLLDKLIDKTTPDVSKFSENDSKWDSISRKYLKRVDPEFLEVYDSIDNPFIQILFSIERNKIAGGGTFYNTPFIFRSEHLRDLSHQEAITFYENILNKVKQDLDNEKQNPNFNEREYLKKKRKEYAVENTSNLGVSRRYR